jgi:hypothetical protein
MRRPAPLAGVLLVGAVALSLPGPGRAQEGHAHDDGRARLGAQALLLVTHASPAFGGDSYTEAYVTQPAVMAHLPLAGRRLTLVGTLNLEPLTLRRGELNAGIFGEGYVDRRHPHTLLHEAMLVGRVERAGIRGSLAAGKGFVPFGTDDPMVRPFAKYPVNHHYAQLLERAVAVGAVAWGTRLAVEAAAFNGDEPEGGYDLPNLRRFGDSWAGRLTVRPLSWRGAAVEGQGSVARVTSPENALGGGLDQRKSSAAVRVAGRRVLLLGEWARTDEFSPSGRQAYRYESILGEGTVRWPRAELGLRAERTTRPEEQRMAADAFRSPRPHDDYSIIGLTRWRVLTARLALSPWAARAEPFMELSRSQATALTSPSLFVPRDFYGASRLWSFSAGLRLRAGTLHPRMGRYGAGSLDAPATAATPGGHHS